MTARPPIAQFGDAIPTNDARPAWLPDGVAARFNASVYTRLPHELEWKFVEAIRLEVPRYDFVYLALERGMVPWFGGDEAPGDWDGETSLFRDGTLAEYYMQGWDWQHRPSDPPHVRAVEIIGYTRKSTSTAVPLAHPAAPQGEEGVQSVTSFVRQALETADRTISLLTAQLSLSARRSMKDQLEVEQSFRTAALAALAPAAIASGRGEGK